MKRAGNFDFRSGRISGEAQNFLGFTKNLDKQGVRSLEWKDVRIHVLTPTKALANNYAHGIDEEGNVVYETVSVYLIYKTDEGWRIQTFNPYHISAGMLAASV